jgi:hypothetical protein
VRVPQPRGLPAVFQLSGWGALSTCQSRN